MILQNLTKKREKQTSKDPYWADAWGMNPLNPHDALKHHFTPLKTDLFFLQPRALEQIFL